MAQAFVTLAYKQLIDANASAAFEKGIWQASYQEYLLKSQAYNPEGKFKTFTELKNNDGRANSLHYKSGFAVDGFIETLNKQIPVIKTTLQEPIRFSSYKFEIIESNITNIQEHKVGITYYTGALMFHAVIANSLLLSDINDSDAAARYAHFYGYNAAIIINK